MNKNLLHLRPRPGAWFPQKPELVEPLVDIPGVQLVGQGFNVNISFSRVCILGSQHECTCTFL